MNDLEEVKRILMSVLKKKIPEAEPEYMTEVGDEGISRLVIVLHLKKIPYVGFTIYVDDILEEYLNCEISFRALIECLVATYHRENFMIYEGLRKLAEAEDT